MANTCVTFESSHEDIIHDAQLDYYGKRLASASSDRTIKIFEISGDKQTLSAEIKGHDGPVWSVGWAHPKYGQLLASGGYDGRVIVWKETQTGVWQKVFQDESHKASVNAVSWGPHSFGLMLAVASADGNVTVFSHKDGNNWSRQSFLAHRGGTNAVSWGPDHKSASLLSHPSGGSAASSPSHASQHVVRRFVTGGCDNTVKMWRLSDDGAWTEQKAFGEANYHSHWVRDVAWAPSIGLTTNTIVSVSEDKSVIIWNEDHFGNFKIGKVLKFDSKVWRASWSVMGNILAISQGDNRVSLWKEASDGEWRTMSTIGEKPEVKPDKKEATL